MRKKRSGVTLSDSLRLIRRNPEGQAKRRIENEPLRFLVADSLKVWSTLEAESQKPCLKDLRTVSGVRRWIESLTGGINFKGRRYTEDGMSCLLVDQTRLGNQALRDICTVTREWSFVEKIIIKCSSVPFAPV